MTSKIGLNWPAREKWLHAKDVSNSSRGFYLKGDCSQSVAHCNRSCARALCMDHFTHIGIPGTIGCSRTPAHWAQGAHKLSNNRMHFNSNRRSLGNDGFSSLPDSRAQAVGFANSNGRLQRSLIRILFNRMVNRFPWVFTWLRLLHPAPPFHKRMIIKITQTTSMLNPSDAPANTNPSSASISSQSPK